MIIAKRFFHKTKHFHRFFIQSCTHISSEIVGNVFADYVLLFHISTLQEDAVQFFKEERTDSAVYNLYLKKVRYHTPASDVGTLSPSSGDNRRHSTFYLNIPSASIHMIKFYESLPQVHALDNRLQRSPELGQTTYVCFVAFLEVRIFGAISVHRHIIHLF